MMDIVEFLSHASKLKVMRTTWAFNRKIIHCGPKSS
jgi:hypothetical protein